MSKMSKRIAAEEKKLAELEIQAKSNWIKADYKLYGELLEKSKNRTQDKLAKMELKLMEQKSPGDEVKSGIADAVADKKMNPKAKGAKGEKEPSKKKKVTFEPTFEDDDEDEDKEVEALRQALNSAEKASGKQSQKIVPPKKRYAGERGEKFEQWERAIDIWRRKWEREGVSDERLGEELMEIVEGDAVDVVYARVPKGEETFSKVMKALKDNYGRKNMPEATAVMREFQQLERGKSKLRDFLNSHISRRSKAIGAGHQVCPETSGNHLLETANLAANLHSQVISMCSAKPDGLTQRGLPKYAAVMEELERLAQSYETTDDRGGRRALMTLGGKEQIGGKQGQKDGGKSSWKGNGHGGKGGGKKGKGKSKGKGKGKGKAGKGKGGERRQRCR